MTNDRVSYHWRGAPCLCVIGILPHERHGAQPVQLDLSLSWSRRDDGTSPVGVEALLAFLPSLLVRVLQEGRFLLVETAVEALGLCIDALCRQHSTIDHIKLTITKTLALQGQGKPVLQWQSQRLLQPALSTWPYVVFVSPEVRITWDGPEAELSHWHIESLTPASLTADKGHLS